jgi:DNA polymerase elongation subunit (family B)
MEHTFRLYDFNVYNKKDDSREESGSDEETNSKTDTNKFVIQMFGLNELGESCSILVEDFKPFFYVKVSDEWTQYTKKSFLQHILKQMGKYYQESITDCKMIKRKKLYGFDGGKEHKFIIFQFKNLQAFNKAKNLWYCSNSNSNSERKLLENGLVYANTSTYLYEANIPPLLRFFHIKDISPSGWVAIPKKKTIEIIENKQTSCKYEFLVEQKYILPLNEKETRVPYKICSFDIEASSSHGDFPVPIKSYKKLATNIIEYFEKIKTEITKSDAENLLRKILLKAFGFSTKEFLEIDLVYPKKEQLPTSEDDVNERIESWLSSKIDTDNKNSDSDVNNQMTIEKMFENMNNEDEEDTTNEFYSKGKKSAIKNYTVVDLLFDKTLSREIKLNELNKSLSDKKREKSFPSLEGDKVTFIGSTFLRAGEKEPFLNHCIVLNTCGKVPVDNCEIESYQTEQDVLTAWTKLIQRENPDIIIGYNIFGFDYAFMFNRALENNCIAEFLKLSKNKNETCCTDPFTGKYKLDESTLQIASGQHDLKYIKINGRIQIDLYNYFRREENLSSYKLDYVAGYFIGDYVKTLEINKEDKNETIIYSGNLTGLLQGSFIHFEEIGHSTDYYSDGAKFSVISINKETKSFIVSGIIKPDMTKKVRWCLAKDDVTPKDIFTMTNGSQDDRAVIAKYCIQDCNLVHYLMNKVDILTGFIEMAKICSVPINFLILRGQGIKLTSYVAKKCREKKTLMPVIEKQENEDGYEGAIVLDPKCDLYLDNPVACVDYASLYPSSMISENLSHDSKVWTKEYNLLGELITVTGDMDETGNPIYDNLPGYDYVDITYDTFKYVRKTPSAAAEKIKSGYKICRFAQFPDNAKAIMPSILQELLLARKTTRKQIPLQTDDFMKNVLDKRQLGYKVTANSLYGQCGARTSTFYEKDIAASTTATGRLLLTYAKKIIENTYGNRICDTSKHGPVLTKAEYIYGDSVANYTPVYIKTNGQIDICTIENLAEKYGENNWLKCKEEGKQEKEFCELQNIETWTDKGWTKLYRVIRHELASHKKMMRVLTHTGLVDVTDDHSLLKPDGNEISPTDLNIGDELLHNKLPNERLIYEIDKILDGDQTFIFNNMLEAAECCYMLNKENKLFEVVYYDYDYDYDYNYDNHPEFEIEISIIKNKPIDFSKINDLNISNEWKEKIKNNIIKNSFAEETLLKNKNKITNISDIQYQGYVYDLTTDNHHFAAGVGNMIVHNTDSVFFTFNLHTPEGKPIRGKDALEITIELAQEAGHLASSFLKNPHDLEYEKTFMPFCLLSKKRYVGMLYEHDPEKCKRKEMGIVLKRRDNAPIVKDIYGGIIDILMKKQNIKEATDFLKSCLKNIVDEKYPMDKLIITKSLRSGYKNPQQIAHKVLADRITSRDPGNKPSSGDRIPFVYIHNSNKKALQGEKIETPTYIKENNLKIDYSFYITNQIMKPVQQLFALVLEKIWEMQNKKGKIIKFKKEVEQLKKSTPVDKFEDKLESIKNKEVKALLFDEFLRETNNQKTGNQSVMRFFK